jgi:hypothetical protein
VIGYVVGRTRGLGVRWCRVLDEKGDPLVAKIEGLSFIRSRWAVMATIDSDDPERPSELIEIEFAGDWKD